MCLDGAWTTSWTIGLRSATGSDDPNKIRGVQLDSLETTFDRDGYVVVCAGLESAFVDLALEHLSRIRAVRLSSQTAAFVTAPQVTPPPRGSPLSRRSSRSSALCWMRRRAASGSRTSSNGRTRACRHAGIKTSGPGPRRSRAAGQ